MLYEAERHESLTATAWNEQAARACINEILDDAVDKFSARDLWPSHPLDSFSPDARWNLYIGGSGTIWALHHLSPKPDNLPDFSIVVPRLLEPNRSWILNVKGAGLDLRTAGLLTADTGILLVQAMVSGVEPVAVQLGSAIDANRDNPACEFMWGSPGTMLASVWLYEWTGQDIWAERFRRDASLLWNRLEFVEEAGCHLWVQNRIALRISARCMALLAMPSPRSGAGTCYLPRSNRAGRTGLPAHSAGRPDAKTIARTGRNPSAGIVRAARPSWCSIVMAHLAS
jgi:hypothetical protein